MKQKQKRLEEALICFSRYYLLSINMPHKEKNILFFLNNINAKTLIKISKSLKENTLVYDIWQIFESYNIEELEEIRIKTKLHLSKASEIEC